MKLINPNDKMDNKTRKKVAALLPGQLFIEPFSLEIGRRRWVEERGRGGGC